MTSAELLIETGLLLKDSRRWTGATGWPAAGKDEEPCDPLSRSAKYWSAYGAFLRVIGRPWCENDTQFLALACMAEACRRLGYGRHSSLDCLVLLESQDNHALLLDMLRGAVVLARRAEPLLIQETRDGLLPIGLTIVDLVRNIPLEAKERKKAA